jgi:hypothetical protein
VLEFGGIASVLVGQKPCKEKTPAHSRVSPAFCRLVWRMFWPWPWNVSVSAQNQTPKVYAAGTDTMHLVVGYLVYPFVIKGGKVKTIF